MSKSAFATNANLVDSEQSWSRAETQGNSEDADFHKTVMTWNDDDVWW